MWGEKKKLARGIDGIAVVGAKGEGRMEQLEKLAVGVLVLEEAFLQQVDEACAEGIGEGGAIVLGQGRASGEKLGDSLLYGVVVDGL